jgi:hypothetical protein
MKFRLVNLNNDLNKFIKNLAIYNMLRYYFLLHLRSIYVNFIRKHAKKNNAVFDFSKLS